MSDEYANVDFAGKDILNPEKTTNGTVQLHSPVSGAYTLLATYERPFKPQGETLTFTGARPADAQSESGYTIITSAYQFQVKPADVSSGLLALESGEVPPEYRLFFDQPVLAAYRYSSRPFNLKLALSPLAQGDSLVQVADRASLSRTFPKRARPSPTRAISSRAGAIPISGDPAGRNAALVGHGQQRGGRAGVDQKSIFIPLPQHADPENVLTLDLKVAATSSVPARVTIAAPIVAAPVMLAEWKLEPDEGQRLIYQSGTLTPAGGTVDTSGFAQIAQAIHGGQAGEMLASLCWRWYLSRSQSSSGAGRRVKVSTDSVRATLSASSLASPRFWLPLSRSCAGGRV